MKNFGPTLSVLGAFYLACASAAAQENPEESVQGGFFFRPSVAVGEVYDDNVFSTPELQISDLITRVSPGLEAAFDAPRFSLAARLGFDAEIFHDHPELTTPEARKTASLEARYRPNPKFSFATTADYFETRTPSELNFLTGLESGRGRAERMAFGVAVDYGVKARTSLTTDYTFAHEGLSDGLRGQIHTFQLGVERRLSSRSLISVGGLGRVYDFVGGPNEFVPALILGWAHEMTPGALVSLRAGPRFSESEAPAAEVLAELRLDFRRGQGRFVAAYARTQETAIGRPEALDTESATTSLSIQWPSGFELSATPGIFRTHAVGFEATVYRLGVDLHSPIASWLALEVSGYTGLQQGGLGPTGTSGEIFHNVVSVLLVVGPRAPFAPGAGRPPKKRLRDPEEVF